MARRPLPSATSSFSSTPHSTTPQPGDQPMSKDVAQRELDQAGFRISNLGNPAAAGDATKTDNSTVPRANTGGGSPGTSLLAAPADHIHPAGGQSVVGRLVFDDPTEQSVGVGAEEVVAEWVVDFD